MSISSTGNDINNLGAPDNTQVAGYVRADGYAIFLRNNVITTGENCVRVEPTCVAADTASATTMCNTNNACIGFECFTYPQSRQEGTECLLYSGPWEIFPTVNGTNAKHIFTRIPETNPSPVTNITTSATPNTSPNENTTTSPSSSNTQENTSANTNVNTGPIVGSVLGGVLLILLAVSTFIYARNKKNKQPDEHLKLENPNLDAAESEDSSAIQVFSEGKDKENKAME